MKKFVLLLVLLPILVQAEIQFGLELSFEEQANIEEIIPIQLDSVVSLMPEFVDIDADGDLDLFLATGQAPFIYYLENVGNAYRPEYKLKEDNLFSEISKQIAIGSTTSITLRFVDLDHDGDFDSVLTQKNGLVYYRNVGSIQQAQFKADEPHDLLEFKFNEIDRNRPIPVFVDIDNDQDKDLFISTDKGLVYFFENQGTLSSPQFVLKLDSSNPLSIIKENTEINENVVLSFADMDQDGDMDMMLGHSIKYILTTNTESQGLGGNIYFYENKGTACSPNFQLNKKFDGLNNIDVGHSSKPILVDINNDNKIDIVMGNTRGNILLFNNISQKEYNTRFSKQIIPTGLDTIFGITLESIAGFIDIDGDGDRDILSYTGDVYIDGISPTNHEIAYYENKRTKNSCIQYKKTIEPKLNNIFSNQLISLHAVDIDSDNRPDMISYEGEEGFVFYKKANNDDFIWEKQTNKILVNNFNEDFDVVSSLNIPVLSSVDIDFDLDTDLFLFLKNSLINKLLSVVTFSLVENNNSIFFNENNNMKFNANNTVLPTDFSYYPQNNSLNFFDYNDDNLLDILLMDSGNRIKIYKNVDSQGNGVQFNSEPVYITLPSDNSLYVSLEIFDLDNDQQSDMLLSSFLEEKEYFYYKNTTPKPQPLVHINQTTGNYAYPLSLSLSCKACQTIYYKIDTAAPKAYTQAIKIQQDTTLQYWADNNGEQTPTYTQTYHIDSQAPSLSVSSDISEWQDLNTLSELSGTVTDNQAIQYVELQLQQINENEDSLYLNSTGGLSPEQQWLSVEINQNNWHYPLDNLNLSAGRYQLKVRVLDKAGNSQTVERNLAVGAILTQLTASPQHILILTDADAAVTGKLFQLGNTDVALKTDSNLLTINISKTDTETICTQNHPFKSNTGDYEFSVKEQLGNCDFTQGNGLIEGEYVFSIRFIGDGIRQSSTAKKVSLRVGEVAGHALLIQGYANQGEGCKEHKRSLYMVRQNLIKRHFDSNHILQINNEVTCSTDAGSDVDLSQLANKAEIEEVLETLRSNVNANPAPIYIVLVDHGGLGDNRTGGQFLLNDTEQVINPSTLDTWLDTLEQQLQPEVLAKSPRIIIMGACYSGGIIPALSADGRMIITSTSADKLSYKGPKGKGGVRNGEFFIDSLFLNLAKGTNFYDAFTQANAITQRFTRRGGDNPQILQQPLLDDNGDGRGSAVLVNKTNGGATGDGYTLARRIYLGAELKRSSNTNSDFTAQVTALPIPIYLSGDADQTDNIVKLAVKDAGQVEVFVEIRQPDLELVNNNQNSTAVQADIPLLHFKLICNTDNLCQLDANSVAYSQELTDHNLSVSQHILADIFKQAGKYELFYYLIDPEGNESEKYRSLVYKADTSNVPPNVVTLKLPKSSSISDNISSSVAPLFDWSDSQATDGTAVTYTLRLFQAVKGACTDTILEEIYELSDSSFLSGIQQQVLTNKGLFTQQAFNPLNNHFDQQGVLIDQFCWQVEAVDQFGSRSQSELRFLKVDNPNAEVNSASFVLQDALTEKNLKGIRFIPVLDDKFLDGVTFGFDEGDNKSVTKISSEHTFSKVQIINDGCYEIESELDVETNRKHTFKANPLPCVYQDEQKDLLIELPLVVFDNNYYQGRLKWNPAATKNNALFFELLEVNDRNAPNSDYDELSKVTETPSELTLIIPLIFNPISGLMEDFTNNYFIWDAEKYGFYYFP